MRVGSKTASVAAGVAEVWAPLMPAPLPASRRERSGWTFSRSRPSICARIWSLVKPVPPMTPAGQAATQVPQPLHSAGLIVGDASAPRRTDGVVRAHVVADAAAGAALLVDRGHDRLDHQLSAGDHAGDAGGRRGALGHRGRNVLRALADAPATNTPSVIVATGSSFGCRSVNQPSMLHEMPHSQADFLGVLRLQAARQDHHVDRDAALLAQRACLPPGRSACPLRRRRRAASVTSATLPRTKMHALFQQPLVELLVVLPGVRMSM